MGTLDYQNEKTARKDLAASWRRRWFGVSRHDVWMALASEVGGRVESGGFWRGEKVVLDVPPCWQITLDTYTVSTGKSSVTYTRMRAPFVNLDGFRFRIWRKSIFSNLGKMLGMQDIEIGDPFFDEDFIIQSPDPHRVRRLLGNPRLRALIAAQPAIRFTVLDDEGWFGATFPAGVDELNFCVIGVIKDLDRLRSLFELFIETLNTLYALGSAHDSPAGVKL